MLARLLLLFILVPMIELALLLLIAQHTSALFTLGLIVFTGVLGAWLARREGTQCLSRIQTELSQGQMPGDSLVDGPCVPRVRTASTVSPTYCPGPHTGSPRALPGSSGEPRQSPPPKPGRR